MISNMGVGRIEIPDHGKSKVVYDFNSWIKSLPIKSNASILDVAQLISEKCWPIFHDEWIRIHPTRPLNLSNDPALPVVGYYIGGNEFLGPQVYFVGIYPDWKNKVLNRPIIRRMHPPIDTTERHNLFATFNGEKGGGMDELTVHNSAIERRYLKSYDKEIGALIYDERLDGTSLANLGKIMLSLEIQTTPTRFSFPVLICSLTANQRASCQSYYH